MKSAILGLCALLGLTGTAPQANAQDLQAEPGYSVDMNANFYRGPRGNGGLTPKRPGFPGGGGGFKPTAPNRPSFPGGSSVRPSKPSPSFPGGNLKPNRPQRLNLPGGGSVRPPKPSFPNKPGGHLKPGQKPSVKPVKPGPAVKPTRPKPHAPNILRPTRPSGSHGKYHKGGWHPRPGWRPGWKWDFHRYPYWWRPTIVLPVWYWLASVPVGYWQCTAFDEDLNAFSEIGATLDEAAYNALYECGGLYWEDFGCYIPQGYCRLRY